MLTQADLKDIRDLIRTEGRDAVLNEIPKIVEDETTKVLRDEIKKAIDPLQKDIDQLLAETKRIEEMDVSMKALQEDMKDLVASEDDDVTTLLKNVRAIGAHLGLSLP